MEGWIKLHRKILDNPIVCKDGETFAIWIYLLLNATHKDIQALFKGQKITLKPGQLITGRKSISKELKISESKIQRTLSCLESEHQIEQQMSTKNRLITIVKWDEYQNSEHLLEQQMNNKRTTSEQQMNTNNNVINKECKNINLININKELKLFDSGDAFSQYLIEQGYTENSFNELSESEQEMISENYILRR